MVRALDGSGRPEAEMSGYLERMVHRRRFLRYAAAVAMAGGANIVVGGVGEAEAARSTVAVYFLDPEWGAQLADCPPDEAERTGHCHACKACHAHAKNKMFSSALAAQTTRAHAFCKCLVGSTQVDRVTAVTIFGPPSGPLRRDEFDGRRDALFLPAAVPAGEEGSQ
jgi:hypothetical protein